MSCQPLAPSQALGGGLVGAQGRASTQRQGRPLRSQWRCSRPAVTTGVRKYEPIFPNPKMSRLAWHVTMLVPFLFQEDHFGQGFFTQHPTRLKSIRATHCYGFSPSWDAKSTGSKKRHNLEMCDSELPTTSTISSTRGRPCRSLRRGLNAQARPPPPGLNGAVPRLP